MSMAATTSLIDRLNSLCSICARDRSASRRGTTEGLRDPPDTSASNFLTVLAFALFVRPTPQTDRWRHDRGRIVW
jgi:hypothetical protein